MQTTSTAFADEDVEQFAAAESTIVNTITTDTIRHSSAGSEPDEQPDAGQPTGTLCTNCERHSDWQTCSWCPLCGFHPGLKRCLDIGLEQAQEQEQEQQQEAQNIWELIPPWLWTLGIGVAAVVGGSIAARVSLGGYPSLRAKWAFAQAVGAATAALVAHVLAFLHASSKSSNITPFDLVLKPIAIWQATFAALPRYASLVWALVWSQTALVCALFVVGGLSYSALFDDWGFKKRTSRNMTQAIADQAQENGSGEESLESAINGVAGSAALADESDPETVTNVDWMNAECVIIGYNKSAENDIATLLLASTVKGRLQYVGLIPTNGIPAEVARELRQRLPTLVQARPFVKCRRAATWVRPVMMCEVEFEDWTRGKRLKRPMFKQMLNDVRY